MITNILQAEFEMETQEILQETKLTGKRSKKRVKLRKIVREKCDLSFNNVLVDKVVNEIEELRQSISSLTPTVNDEAEADSSEDENSILDKEVLEILQKSTFILERAKTKQQVEDVLGSYIQNENKSEKNLLETCIQHVNKSEMNIFESCVSNGNKPEKNAFETCVPYENKSQKKAFETCAPNENKSEKKAFETCANESKSQKNIFETCMPNGNKSEKNILESCIPIENKLEKNLLETCINHENKLEKNIFETCIPIENKLEKNRFETCVQIEKMSEKNRFESCITLESKSQKNILETLIPVENKSEKNIFEAGIPNENKLELEKNIFETCVPIENDSQENICVPNENKPEKNLFEASVLNENKTGKNAFEASIPYEKKPEKDIQHVHVFEICIPNENTGKAPESNILPVLTNTLSVNKSEKVQPEINPDSVLDVNKTMKLVDVKMSQRGLNDICGQECDIRQAQISSEITRCPHNLKGNHQVISLPTASGEQRSGRKSVPHITENIQSISTQTDIDSSNSSQSQLSTSSWSCRTDITDNSDLGVASVNGQVMNNFITTTVSDKDSVHMNGSAGLNMDQKSVLNCLSSSNNSTTTGTEDKCKHCPSLYTSTIQQEKDSCSSQPDHTAQLNHNSNWRNDTSTCSILSAGINSDFKKGEPTSTTNTTILPEMNKYNDDMNNGNYTSVSSPTSYSATTGLSSTSSSLPVELQQNEENIDNNNVTVTTKTTTTATKTVTAAKKTKANSMEEGDQEGGGGLGLSGQELDEPPPCECDECFLGTDEVSPPQPRKWNRVNKYLSS